MNKRLLIWMIFWVHTAYSQDGYIPGQPALAYWQLGNKAETIIILHGGPAVAHQYLRPEFDQLSEVGQVIYYDQRGCGKSEKADSYVWQEHVKDLQRVIRTFSEQGKVILVGSSWGSILAIVYAYSHPEDVKALILSGTIEWQGKAMNQEDYLNYKKKNYDSIQTRIHTHQLREKKIIQTKVDEGNVKVDTVLIEKEIVQHVGAPSKETIFSLGTAPVIDSLRSIALPVLIFNGDRQNCKIDRGYQYAEVLPLAALHTIPGACHDPWMSNPTAFSSKCKSFIVNLNKKK